MGSIEDPSVHEPADAAEPQPAAEDSAPDDDTAGSVARADASDGVDATPNPEALTPAPDSGSGHPVRDRLLARAREARPEARVSGATERFSERTPRAGSSQAYPPQSVESELLKIAASSGHGFPGRPGGAPLSSLSVLLLGTVFGLAGFALFFALLFEFAPREPQSVSLSVPDEVPAATPSSEPTLTVPAVAPPPPRQTIPGPWRIDTAGDGQRVLRGKIGREPFLRAIQEAGLDKTQAYRVYTALKSEKDLDHCRPSDEFVALVDRTDGRVLAFEYIASREEVYQARQGEDGLLTGKQLDLSVERGRVQGSLVIAVPSFAENATRSHFDPGLGVVINKALEGHITVEEFQIGDRLRVVAQEVTVLGQFSRYAGLEALEYIPARGDPIRVYYFENKKRYYDAKGRAPGEGGWRRPVPGAPITSRFNPKRLHPILKKVMPHNGTDFGAPTGTPIVASSAGKITKLGNYGANGNYIAIEHRGGYETGYSHLSRFEPGLKVGDTVQRLQPIGYVGSTGRSTGPHLHFSAKKDGKYIDPESLGLDRLTTLPKEELALFQKVKQKYDELLEAVPLPPAIASPSTSEGNPLDRDEDFHDGTSETEELPMAAAVPPAAVPLAAVPPAAVPATVSPAQAPVPQAAVPGRTGSALYLTDKELMQTQSLVDDGEVEQ